MKKDLKPSVVPPSPTPTTVSYGSRGTILKVVGASWERTRISTLIVGGFLLFGVLIIVITSSLGRNKEDDGNYSATVVWQKKVGYNIQFWGQGNALDKIPLGAARGYYRKDTDANGWAKIEIETNGEEADWVQAYSAGLLEGSLTWQLIYWRWKNTIDTVCYPDPSKCNSIREELSEWSNRIRSIALKMSTFDQFWHQLWLFFVQLDGIETGWNYATKRSLYRLHIETIDFLWLNLLRNDILLPGIGLETLDAPSLTTTLIRFNEQTQTVHVAQAKAAPYRDMLRLIKRYTFGYKEIGTPSSSPIPGNVITFTGYPGSIISQDEFYAIKSKHLCNHSLIVVGSTIGKDAGNEEYKFTASKRPSSEQVPSTIRAMIASRLSRDNHNWIIQYNHHMNSVSIAKQWTIVDLSKLSEESYNTSSKGFLSIVEQAANLIQVSDQSRLLRKRGYWATYGLPFHKNIEDILHLPKDNDDLYSYTKSKRAKLFELCRYECTSDEEIFNVIRNGIRPSKDLMGARADLYHDNPLPYGVIDTKIITGSFGNRSEMKLIAGPVFSKNDTTNGNIDAILPFQWAISEFSQIEHIGHPDVWQFPFYTPKWIW